LVLPKRVLYLVRKKGMGANGVPGMPKNPNLEFGKNAFPRRIITNQI